MNAKVVESTVHTPGLMVAGIAATLLIGAVLLGMKLPFIATDRAAFFLLVLLGFVMCALGPLSKVQPADWANPIFVAGILLGVAATLLAISQLIGFKLPFVSDAHAAFLLLAGIMGLKVVLALFLRL